MTHFNKAWQFGIIVADLLLPLGSNEGLSWEFHFVERQSIAKLERPASQLFAVVTRLCLAVDPCRASNVEGLVTFLVFYQIMIK